MMSWEGAEIVGAQAIMEKLGSLPSMKHQVTTVDAQAISNNNMIVYVTGKLSVRTLQKKCTVSCLMNICVCTDRQRQSTIIWSSVPFGVSSASIVLSTK